MRDLKINSLGPVIDMDSYNILDGNEAMNKGIISYDIASKIVKELSLGMCNLLTYKKGHARINTIQGLRDTKHLNLLSIIHDCETIETIFVTAHDNSISMKEVARVLIEIAPFLGFKGIFSSLSEELAITLVPGILTDNIIYTRIWERGERCMTLEEFKKFCESPELIRGYLEDHLKYKRTGFVKEDDEDWLFPRIVRGCTNHVLESNNLPDTYILKEHEVPNMNIFLLDVVEDGPGFPSSSPLRYIYYYHAECKYLCILNLGRINLFGPAYVYMDSLNEPGIEEDYTTHNGETSGVIYRL